MVLIIVNVENCLTLNIFFVETESDNLFFQGSCDEEEMGGGGAILNKIRHTLGLLFSKKLQIINMNTFQNVNFDLFSHSTQTCSFEVCVLYM